MTEADAINMMANRPIGAYFAVGDSFFSYSGGLVKNGDWNCDPYPATINHAMAVVGLDLMGEEDPEDQTEIVVHARWADSTGCDDTEYTLDDYPDFCLWDVETTV